MIFILFAKKAKGRLKFYINYRKLNKLIKKDSYLILLINKILARICKVKVFIKLDV